MKRNVLVTTCLAIYFLSLTAWASRVGDAESNETESPSRKRPNVLIAFADDWGRHASAYRQEDKPGICDHVATPNFDRIAREGILFSNAYVSAPSCTPCRSSLFSGRNFWETGRGAILRGAVWDQSLETFPLLMQKEGYHIGFSNKAWSPGKPADAPFGGKQNKFNQHGQRFNGFSQQLSRNQNSDTPSLEGAKQQLLDEVRANFAQFQSARPDDAPFLYFWGPTNIHRKWIAGSGKNFWDIDPSGLKGKLPSFLPDVELVREDVADYLGEVQAFDLGLGCLLEQLKAIGELDNTIIIVSGDHGPAGFPNGKCSLYDFGTRVPLAIRMPGQSRPSRRVKDLISLPDLAPTLLEACNITVPSSMSARSMNPILSSEESGWVDPDRKFIVTGRERHVAEAREGYKPYPQRAIRTQEYLFIRNFEPDRWPMGTGPSPDAKDEEFPTFEKIRENTRAAWADFDASPTKAWIAYHCREPELVQFFQHAFGKRPARELYRISDDPDQVHNLMDRAEYSEVAQDLEKQLMEYLQKTNDPRVVGDKMTFERPPFTDKN